MSRAARRWLIEIIKSGPASAVLHGRKVPFMILSQKTAQGGTTLLETSIAACTAAMFLGSLFTMNITAMKNIRVAREASSASQVLQQRVEAMRIANWHQITDPTWVSSNLLQ